MTYIVTEDMPGIGLVRGQVVTIISTAKAIGRVTIKTDTGETHVIDAWRVAPHVEGEK